MYDEKNREKWLLIRFEFLILDRFPLNISISPGDCFILLIIFFNISSAQCHESSAAFDVDSTEARPSRVDNQAFAEDDDKCMKPTER